MDQVELSLIRKQISRMLILSMFIGLAFLVFSPEIAKANTGINQRLNFQGRLMNTQGAIVADGYYNVEFKIYQDGDGLTVGTTGTPAGTAEWTESHLNVNTQGVMIKNGFMSVDLGSITAFGTNIDWNQDTLWLSINIGDTNATCTPFSNCNPDGEMLPMKRLASSPYALNSGQLGGLSSAQFVQLAQGVQTDASTNTNSIYINKTGTGNLISLQSSGSDVFTISNTGNLEFGANANHTLSVATAAADTAGKSLTVSGGAGGTGAGALAGGDLLLQGGAAGGANSNGGNIAIDAGAKSGSGSDGSINIGTSVASTIQIGSTTLATGTQTVNVGNNNTAGSTTNVTIGSGSSATAGTTAIQGKGNVSVTSHSGTMTIGSAGNMNLTSSAGTVVLSGSGNSSFSTTAGTLSLTGNNDTSVSSVAGTLTLTGNGNTSLSSTTGTLGLTGSGNTTLSSTNGTLGLTSNGVTTIGTNGATRATFDTSYALYLGAGVTGAANPFTLSATGGTAGVAGSALAVQGGVGGSNSAGGALTLSGGAGGSTSGNGGVISLQGGNATAGNSNGGNVAIDAGAKSGSGTDGSINIGTSVASTIQIGSTTLATGTQTVNIGNNNTAGSTTNVTIGSDSSATAGTTTIQGKGNVGVTSSSGNVSVGATSGTMTISSSGNASMSSSAGTLQLSGNGNSSLSSVAGTLALTGNGDTTVSSTAGALGLSSSGNTTVSTNGATRATFDNTYSLYLGTGVTGAANPFTLSSTGGTAGVAGSALNVQGGTGGSNAAGGALTIKGGAGGATSGAGGALTIQGGNAAAGNSNGGDLTLNAGLKSGSGTDGDIYLGNTNTNTIQIGNNTLAASTQTINIGTNNTAGGTTNVTIGSGSSATGGTTTVQGKGNVSVTSNSGTMTISSSGNASMSSSAGTITVSSSGNASLTSTAGTVGISSSGNTTLSTNGTTRATFDTANGLYLGNGVTATAPNNFTISGTGSSTTAVTGGSVTVQGGNATVGNANGGNIVLSGGSGFGTGVNGVVVINSPTFSTTINDANCYTGGALVANDCTISASSVNNTGAVIVGFSATGKTATLPDPSNATAGRIVYVTAANASQDFSLSVNGGGMGNVIAMRQNTTATMIWNGNDWTAAGASSSTTLQSAYDNTMQSAGGAELVVSHTGTTNGLTIRDSSTNPVNGTLLAVQTSSAATLFSVNSNVTEYTSNSGAETAGASANTFPASTWSSVGSSTVSRYTTAGNYIATGQASASVTTTTAANDGIKNTLSSALTANMHYNVSFSARLTSGTFTDMNVYYSIDGSTASVACTTSQAIVTSIWTKVNCEFTTPSSGITSSNSILIRQTASGTARTFYVDNISVTIAADYSYATDGSVSDGTNFATNYSFVNATSGAGSVSRNTSDGYDASDSAGVTITTGAANTGLRNKLSMNPLPSTLYRISVYAKLSSGTFTDFKIRYSRDGSTGSSGNYVDCVDYNTQTLSTTAWTKITCYLTTDSTAATNPYVNFVEGSSATRTFYIDAFTMTIAQNTTPNVQIGSGVNGGPTTLFTLDRAASAPVAANMDSLLGSMYYDTSLGKLQCYELDGWGACGSSPDNIVTISPEYTNAVMHGTGIGTMTSDLCSSTLGINDGSSGQPTICGSNETYNFYKWTSPQASAQTYSIYVTYQLPATFKEFSSGQTSLMGRTDSANSTVQYQIYKSNSATGLTACGSAITVSTGSQTSWQVVSASGSADPSTCGFAPSDSVVFKISLSAQSNANAYVGNLNFTFSNK